MIEPEMRRFQDRLLSGLTVLLALGNVWAIVADVMWLARGLSLLVVAVVVTRMVLS